MSILIKTAEAAPSAPQVVSYDTFGNRIKLLLDITLSPSGRFVGLLDTNTLDNNGEISVRDRSTGITTLEVPSIYKPRDFAISSDGRYLYFSSNALNVDINYPNGAGGTWPTIYVKDRLTSVISLVQVDANGNGAWITPVPVNLEIAPSEDGTIFAWQCVNLQTICVRNIQTKTTIAYPSLGKFERLSGNGRYLFYRDSNGNQNRYDLATATTLSLSSYIPTNYFITQASYNGQYVLYTNTTNSQLRDYQRLDISSGGTVSVGQGYIIQLSGDGSTAAIFSDTFSAYNFNTGISSSPAVNKWGHEADTGATTTASSKNVVSNLISTDGSEVLFYSDATNLGCPTDVLWRPCAYVASTTGPMISGNDDILPQITQVIPAAISKDRCALTPISITTTDDNSGVVGAELYVKTYPSDVRKYGYGEAMTGQGGLFTGIIDNHLPAGTYTFAVRAVDAAGNWSQEKLIPVTITSSQACSLLIQTGLLNP